MLVVNDPYVEARDGNVYVGKTRVTLEDVVLRWKQGEMPEVIHEQLPTVAVAAAYGAIAFYLLHQQEVDAYFAEAHAEADRLYAEMKRARPQSYLEMRTRLAATRQEMQQQSAESRSDASQRMEHQSA